MYYYIIITLLSYLVYNNEQHKTQTSKVKVKGSRLAGGGGLSLSLSHGVSVTRLKDPVHLVTVEAACSAAVSKNRFEPVACCTGFSRATSTNCDQRHACTESTLIGLSVKFRQTKTLLSKCQESFDWQLDFVSDFNCAPSRRHPRLFSPEVFGSFGTCRRPPGGRKPKE